MTRVDEAYCQSCQYQHIGEPPTKCPRCGGNAWALLTSVATVSVLGGDPPTIVVSQPLARDWYDDARREAGDSSIEARRREILFAVCLAECYLVDWVRDHVANADSATMQRYMGAGDMVRRRWTETPERLAAAGLIRAVPSIDAELRERWDALLTFRNALAHGRTSWPWEVGRLSTISALTLLDLERMGPGAALEVVLRLIRAFHTAGGVALPEWIRRDDCVEQPLVWPKA